MAAEIIHADCRDAMRAMDAASVDAIVSDPPYGLSFMGKGWDHGVPGAEFWEAALRVAKPGAYLLAFGGTRTFHRLACAIEDAGWEVQDALSWLYGSGFPKHASKLKPAWEPIILARRPAPRATPLQIDACRLDLRGEAWGGNEANAHGDYSGKVFGSFAQQYAKPSNPAGRWPANVVLDEDAAAALDAQSGERPTGAIKPYVRSTTPSVYGLGMAKEGREVTHEKAADTGGASRFFYTAKASKAERWEYLSCDCEAVRLHAWESEDRSPSAPTDCTSPPRAICGDSSTGGSSLPTSPYGSASTDECPPAIRSTTSTATSKTIASTTCGSSAPRSTSASIPGASFAASNGGSPAASAASSSPSALRIGTSPAKAGRSTGVAVPATSRASSATSNCAACGKAFKRSGHPTVKPVSLMRWLCRLVTPPGGLVLDPFCGSGSTGVAAIAEGFRFVGCEREAEYAEIARARLAHALERAQPTLEGVA